MNFNPRYKVIADQIISDIRENRLSINDKLPSLRGLCGLHNISMTTALSCYQYLMDEGFVIAKAKKGYFVQKPTVLKNDLQFPAFDGKVIPADHYRPNDNSIFATHSFSTAQLDESLMDLDLLKKAFI